MNVIQSTTEKAAWEKASCIAGLDPDETRKDKEGISMDRDMCNVAGPGGWAVDIRGNAIAYEMSGYPAMGDALLSSVKVTWCLPDPVNNSVYPPMDGLKMIGYSIPKFNTKPIER